MPTTYTNGLKLPDLGSIDWYNSYKNNIDILDPIVGTVNGVATTYAPISHNHSASEITSGTIDIARLPPAALERMHIVADQTARYALTTSTVQEGDTVKQTDTGVMYLVVDSTKLNSADGYTEYSAGTASKAIADEDGTSIKTGYVNVAGNQTVSGDKSFTGSNTFNNILPNATNSYSLGSSSYQWSSVYAQTYYYNGTQWGLDKDNVWTGANTFTAPSVKGHTSIINDSMTLGTVPASTLYNGYWFKGSTSDLIGSTDIEWASNGTASMVTRLARNTSGASRELAYGFSLPQTGNGVFRVYGDCLPGSTNEYALGTSTNKWKTLNGYEPSALGEVYVGNEVTIDTTNWALDGSAWNTLNTSIMSGWVYFAVADCDADSFILFRRGSSKAKNPTICFHPQHANSGTYYLYGLFMVPKNTSCIVAIKTGTNGVLSQALLYPCFGNV